MNQKLAALLMVVAAVLVLCVSVFKTGSVRYAFSQSPSPTPENAKKITVDYPLPEIALTPENPFWPVHALMDKIDTSVATGNLEKAQMYLEDADKRLVAGMKMVERGKVEEGFVVFEKAEQYLSESYETILLEKAPARDEFLMRLSLAALKHREVLEIILYTSPDDAREVVSRTLDTPKLIYENSSSNLRNSGLVPPVNPF